jgi:hypothetical protein
VRPIATIVLVLLTPALLAPSCTHPPDDPPGPDSKRALRQGLIGGVIVLYQGDKALTAPRATCVYRGPGGIRDSATGVTTRCRDEGSLDDPENGLPISADDRFRVLTNGGEEVTEVYALPGLAAPRGICPGRLPLVDRREDRGKTRSRWDFELRGGPAAPEGIRIAIYEAAYVSCYDLALTASD